MRSDETQIIIMSSSGTLAERSGRLCAIAETGTQSAAGYRGAVPMRQRQSSQDNDFILDELKHVKPCNQAAVKLPNWYQSSGVTMGWLLRLVTG